MLPLLPSHSHWNSECLVVTQFAKGWDGASEEGSDPHGAMTRVCHRRGGFAQVPSCRTTTGGLTRQRRVVRPAAQEAGSLSSRRGQGWLLFSVRSQGAPSRLVCVTAVILH